MRVAFVTPRFGTDAPTAPERLAEELANAGSKRWLLNVLTTARGERKGRPVREGMQQAGKIRIHRFPVDGELSSEHPDELASEALLRHLGEESYDVVLLFGAGSAVSRGAVRVVPEQTVLLPFADDEPDEAASEVFERAGAFIFGNETEEVRVLRKYGVDRRMRETIEIGFHLPRDLDPEGFREWAGIRGQHLLCPFSAESNRVVQDFVRLFQAFRDSHSRAHLDLVVLGPPPAGPRRPDTRFVEIRSDKERLDAIAGAFAVVLPERLTGIAATVEPFSLGVPVLVHASASELVEECEQSNGGLYYRDHKELEIILEMGLHDPGLFRRLGDSGREHLLARNDWKALVDRFDQAFRSFSRPSRSKEEAPPHPPSAPPAPDEAAAPEETPAPQPDEKDSEEGLPSFFRGGISQS